MKRILVFTALAIATLVVLFLFWPREEGTMEPSVKDEFPNPDSVARSAQDVSCSEQNDSASTTKDPVHTYDFSRPLRILSSDPNLPENIKKALSLVAHVSKRHQWRDDQPIEIEETETRIIITWPSRQEGKKIYRADYEAEAIIDKETFSVVSIRAGS